MSAEHPPDAHAAEEHDERHGYAHYVVVGVILTVVTIVEIMIPSIDAIRNALGTVWTTTSLLVLSFLKGAGVVMYYMHLKGDDRLFTALFMFPFMIATTIVIILFLFWTLTGLIA